MGDGGAIFTPDEALASRMKQLAFHGQTSKYQYGEVGCNSRLDSMQAAILEVKLRHLDQFVETRRKTAEFYNEKLKDHPKIITPKVANYSSHVYHQYTLQIEGREKLKGILSEKGIPFVTYYPGPLHLEKAYQYLGYKEGNFPTSEKLSREALSIPMHTELDNDQLEYITDTINHWG